VVATEEPEEVVVEAIDVNGRVYKGASYRLQYTTEKGSKKWKK